MDPVEALELQRSMIEFWQTEIGLRFATGFAADKLMKHNPGASVEDVQHAAVAEGRKFVAQETLRFKMAECFAIDESMHDLVKYAADSMPSQQLRRYDPPSEFGFCLLPEDMGRFDVNHMMVSWRAFSWWVRPASNVVHLTFYTHFQADQTKDWNATQLHPMAVKLGMPLIMLHQQTVPFDQDLDLLEAMTYGGQAVGEDVAEQTRQDVRYILAFWTLSKQVLSEREVVQGPRSARRRWTRIGLSEKTVSVIRLRRHKGEFTGDGDSAYRHQWVVRGHWRHQPFGPGRAEKRWVWVAPYVKGPEGAPLLAVEKVNFLTR